MRLDAMAEHECLFFWRTARVLRRRNTLYAGRSCVLHRRGAGFDGRSASYADEARSARGFTPMKALAPAGRPCAHEMKFTCAFAAHIAVRMALCSAAPRNFMRRTYSVTVIKSMVPRLSSAVRSSQRSAKFYRTRVYFAL